MGEGQVRLGLHKTDLCPVLAWYLGAETTARSKDAKRGRMRPGEHGKHVGLP